MNEMKLFKLYNLIPIVLMSCTRMQTLNTRPHFYSQNPNQIIWIQLAGFSPEHLPILKYNNQTEDLKSWFESVDCSGNMFSYNLTQLRPEAEKSYLSQMLGSKNIKNSCEDLNRHFVWNEFATNGYGVSIIENGVSENDSLEKYKNCNNGFVADFDKIRLWKMSKTQENGKVFHYQESKEKILDYQKPGVYYDKSCQSGTCYSTLQNNLKALGEKFLSSNEKNMLIIREFSFLNAMKKKDLGKAREAVVETEQLLKWLEATSDKKNTLIVVSGAETTNVEYPLEGREWEEFMKNGKNFVFKKTGLMSNAFASGAGAENFCGIYEESEFAQRLQFIQPKKQFYIDSLNPFTN